MGSVNIKNKITSWQLTFFIIQCQIGVGILSLPNRLHVLAKAGGWISILLAGLMIQMLIILFYLLMKKFPGDTIYDISIRLFGNICGTILNAGYTMFFILVGIAVMLNACAIIKNWILHSTPFIVIIFLFTISGLYVAHNSFKVIVRFNALVSVTIFFMIILIARGLLNNEILYLFPVLESGWRNIFYGSIISRLDMGGFELLLIVYPWAIGSDISKLKAASIANGFVVFFYIFITLTCFMKFSPQQIELVSEPVIYLLRSLHMGFIDRIDLIFIPIWMVTIVTFIGNYLYVSSVGIKSILKLNSNIRALPILSVIFFGAACFFDNPQKIEGITQLPENSSHFFTFIFPLVLVLYINLKDIIVKFVKK